MTKALISITSYHDVFYADGAKTGLFIVEALHPFEVFQKAGVEVTFVSEDGTWGPDDHSLDETFLNGADKEAYENTASEFRKALAQIKKPSEVNASDYDIFFASAGHGTLFDYPTAQGLIELAESIYKNNGVVAAVCHGPAIFTNLKDPATGEPLIKGKKVTGFTDVGEEQLQLEQIMADKKLESVEQMAIRLGAEYIAPQGPWDDFSVTDGRVVTGVNPASAVSTAQKAVEALSK